MASQSTRAAIVELHKKKVPVGQISQLLGALQPHVSRTISRFKELGDLSDRKRAGRPATANTSRNRNIIRNRILRNPKRSMRKMGKELGISKDSVNTIIKKNLGLKSFKVQKAHVLTERMKKVRLQRSKLLKQRFGRAKHRNIVFSDEKIFTIEEQFNKQNTRILSPTKSSANDKSRIVSRTSHPTSIMVWGRNYSKWQDSACICRSQGQSKQAFLQRMHPRGGLAALGPKTF